MSTSLQSEYAMKYKELMCLIVERYRDYKDVQLLNESKKLIISLIRPIRPIRPIRLINYSTGLLIINY